MKKKTDGARKKGTVADLFRSSLILKGLGKLSSLIMKKLSNSFIAGIFTSYEKETEAVGNSLMVQIGDRLDLGRRIAVPFKHRVSKWKEESAILNSVNRVFNMLLAYPMKSYGIFLFSFALYSAIVYLFKLFYLNDASEIVLDIGYIVSVGMMLIASVGMIASRHCLGAALRTSPASRFFLFKVVGLRTNCLDHIEAGASKFHVAFLFGLLFGCTSFVIHPVTVLLAAAALIILYLVLIKPEFGVLSILTLLPFLPTMVLVAAVLYVTVCWLIKVMTGKRSVKLDLLDSVILIFMLLTVGGGIFSVSSQSIAPMLVYVAFMLGYFLTVNLIRSKEWVIKCIVGATVSCTLVSLYGLYQNFFGTLATTWQDKEMFSNIAGRVVSTFENPNVLAEYLIMLMPLMLSLIIITKAPRTRFASFLALALTGGCLIYTWSRGAWLGFMIGILLFMLMYSKNTLTVLLLGMFAVPFLPFILPDSIVQRFTSIGNMGDSSTSYRVNIWRGVIDMLGDYWEGGIGIGLGPFRAVYPRYSLNAIEAAPHSHNLFLQITVEIGIVGLIVFIIAMFLYAQSAFSLHSDETRCERLVSTALFCGIISVLAQGMTDYIWYNYRVFLMFWMVIGLGVAVRKIMRSTVDDRKL